MDRSSRRKVNKRNALCKVNQELNGNIESGIGYKQDTSRRHKQTRERHKSDFKDHGRVDNVLPEYLPVRGQRLFTAVSDPAVCGYPVPLAYPYDPMPVSMGYPVYQPALYPQRMAYKETSPSQRRFRHRNNIDKEEPLKDTFQTVDEYTSLPPVNLQDIESDQQRRFSDPGLANNSCSEEDSLSNNGSEDSWYEDRHFAQQIETLVQENKRLSKELKETQDELQELKLEVASLSQVQSSCEPGFITELVREVHEATKLREEAFFARMKSLTENLNQSLPSISNGDSRKGCTKDCAETKERLATVSAEKEELTVRLTKLEHQMSAILTRNSSKALDNKELIETQKENLQLKEDLKCALDAKQEAERNTTKYEQLLSMMSRKLPNGLLLENKTPETQNQHRSLDNESLSSSLGSGSLPTSLQPQVTMSGPVTDL